MSTHWRRGMVVALLAFLGGAAALRAKVAGAESLGFKGLRLAAIQSAGGRLAVEVEGNEMRSIDVTVGRAAEFPSN